LTSEADAHFQAPRPPVPYDPLAPADRRRRL